MRATILYARIGDDSVAQVAEAMAQEVQVVRSNNGVLTPNVANTDILIRFGCTSKLMAGIVYNEAKAIRLASNKVEARRAWQQAGLPIPEPGTSQFPCIGRPTKHHGGKRVWVCHNENDVLRVSEKHAPVYFSAFYPKKREFRVHVAHGRVLIVNEKLPRQGHEYLRNKVVWNHALNDFYFHVLRWGNWPLNVVELAAKAVEVIGLDFGAVDVMADPADEDLPPAVICEVNTGMSIDSPYTTIRYARYFDWLVRQGSTKKKHYEVSSDRPNDYAWVFKRRD